MKKFFRKLSLPVKLVLISIIPLAFIIYLSAQLYVEKKQKLQLFNSYLRSVTQSSGINKLIDELQAERRYTFDYALTKNWEKEVHAQRPRTDSIIRKLEEVHDEGLGGFTSYTFLRDLPDVRRKVDSGTFAANPVMHYYTNMIFRLNTLNAVPPGSRIYLGEAYKDLETQRILSQMITYLGIMRSNIYNVLYTRMYMVETLIGMTGVHEVYNTYETEFLLKAPAKTISQYKQILNKSELKPTVDYIDRLFRNFKFDSSYNADTWWKVSANGIIELQKLQENLQKNALAEMNRIFKTEQRNKNATLISLIISLILIIAIVAYSTYDISKILRELKVAAQRISLGGTDYHFHHLPDDVVGNLGASSG